MSWEKIEDHLFENYCVEGEDTKLSNLMKEHDKEVKDSAIKEFVEKLKESILQRFKHLVTTDTDGFEWLTTDSVETHIEETVKNFRIN